MTAPDQETGGLRLVDVRARYGSVEVLHGVTMAFPAGAVTALIGRNGAGKSTALRCLAGLTAIGHGRLGWGPDDVTGWSTHRRSVAGMTLIPDTQGIFPSLTVGENLRLFARDDRLDPALALFPELAGRLSQRAGTLSGGEQQMVSLSRAFLRPGRAVLVDEVSRGLSPAVTSRVYRALATLVAVDRVVVVVEQYLDEVLGLADVAYVLARGEVAFAGEPAELLAPAGRDAPVARDVPPPQGV